MNTVTTRFFVSTVLAFGVTFSLFSFMSALILTSDAPINEDPTLKLSNIAMLDSDIKENVKDQKPAKSRANELAPRLPQPDFSNPVPAFEALSITPPEVSLDMDFGVSDLLALDSEYQPIIKVAPQYPIKALQRGIQGYVLLEFTVSKQGTVKDPFIIESKPPGIFDGAAIKAALKFKYKPRVIDGKPIEAPGVRNKITFVLDEH